MACAAAGPAGRLPPWPGRVGRGCRGGTGGGWRVDVGLGRRPGRPEYRWRQSGGRGRRPRRRAGRRPRTSGPPARPGRQAGSAGRPRRPAGTTPQPRPAVPARCPPGSGARPAAGPAPVPPARPAQSGPRPRPRRRQAVRPRRSAASSRRSPGHRRARRPATGPEPDSPLPGPSRRSGDGLAPQCYASRMQSLSQEGEARSAHRRTPWQGRSVGADRGLLPAPASASPRFFTSPQQDPELVEPLGEVEGVGIEVGRHQRTEKAIPLRAATWTLPRSGGQTKAPADRALATMPTCRNLRHCVTAATAGTRPERSRCS
jgi:hypothetical protein